MDEADVEAETFGAALLVHEAGHVGGNDVLGPGAVMVLDLVVAHSSRDWLLEHGKRATEAAAFIRAAWGDELDASHLTQEIERFGEERLVNLRSFGGAQAAQRCASVVQPDLVRKFRPREFVDLHQIVQKLDQLVGAATDLLDQRCLRDCVEMLAYVVGATPRWRDDGFKLLKVRDEQCLGASRILLTSAVRHRLTTARLIEGVDHIDSQPLQ